MELNGKYGEVKIFTNNIEDAALSQVIQMANSPIGENAHIRIMPDCHAGAGCVIGTTMQITDKVCPNLVGVDIGCGVLLVKANIKFASRLDELDRVIRNLIPYGMACHNKERYYPFEGLRCWDKLSKDTQELALHSLGTLGGGNHFIEAYENGWLAVHSGSRNIGYKVAEYYQKLAEKEVIEYNTRLRNEELQTIEPEKRQEWLASHKINVKKELAYLQGESMEDYLHDIEIIQEFAELNRRCMVQTIVQAMGGKIERLIESTHNYINTNSLILRKGAIAANEGQELVIPLNMRDGILICRGKGNEDWNFSAPHGAGRLYSRSEAKRNFTVEEYLESMAGIYSTCIDESTLDEAPFVYKDWQEIVKFIEPTVEILEHYRPIYNFKAN